MHSLIVESGSSKTEWALCTDHGQIMYTSAGINPSTDTTMPNLFSEIPDLKIVGERISTIHYYGAGVADTHSSEKVSRWLSVLFPHASTIEVQSDMIAACRATAGDQAGIVCILGTGSNSCIYDGATMVDNIPSLGYVISNEGGGTDVGRAVLRSFFYRQMPEDVQRRFVSAYNISKASMLTQIYHHPSPAKTIAHYAKFVNACGDDNWRRSILQAAFHSFISSRIMTYDEYVRYRLHFVGSIAYFCQDILREALKQYNLQAESIIQKPIEGLIRWHNNH